MTQVRVFSARKLSPALRKQVEQFVTKRHSDDPEVTISFDIDASLLGGILIIDGDDYFDGTLKSELMNIRKQM